MSSKPIVLELQQLASDSETSVTVLLRKALIVATKLKITDFKQWVEDELDGYVGKEYPVPKYRQAMADVRAFNP